MAPKYSKLHSYKLDTDRVTMSHSYITCIDTGERRLERPGVRPTRQLVPMPPQDDAAAELPRKRKKARDQPEEKQDIAATADQEKEPTRKRKKAAARATVEETAEESAEKPEGSSDSQHHPKSKWGQAVLDPGRFCKNCGERTYVNKWYWGLHTKKKSYTLTKVTQLHQNDMNYIWRYPILFH